MVVLIRGYLVSLKIFSARSGKTMCRTHESFGVVGTYSTCSITHSPMPSLVDIGIHPPPERPKTLSLCVCLFVALLNVQSLCARFRHEGVSLNDFDAFVCSCAIAGNWRHHKMPKSKKRKKLGFIAARGRQNKPMETRSVHHGSALAHAALNLDLIGKRGSVQEPPNV